MTSFQISISPSRRVATRFIDHVRRTIQQALLERRREFGLTQSKIAQVIGVNKSVISREIRGEQDMTLGRVGEIAYALGKRPVFELRDLEPSPTKAFEYLKVHNDFGSAYIFYINNEGSVVVR